MNPECPVCFSDDWQFLGTLGRRDNFRCRSCGADFSTWADEPEGDI